MVMRSCRAISLVGIVEFIMYGCMKYFKERYMAASINISNPKIQFCTRVTQYMQQKIEKVKLHRVISTGIMEHRFEVLCKDRSGRGIRRDRVVQEPLSATNLTTGACTATRRTRGPLWALSGSGVRYVRNKSNFIIHCYMMY